MSIMNPGRGNRTGNENRSESTATAPSAHSPRPAIMTKEALQAEQHKLGSIMLDAVDHLTGMSADQIEAVADRLMEGARETEDILRELARRVREHGLFASEKLANFVKAANNCADTARAMQATLEKRDDPPATGSPAEAQRAAVDQPAGPHRPTDLNALQAKLDTISAEIAPPTQPEEGIEMARPRASAGDEDQALETNRPSRPARRA